MPGRTNLEKSVTYINRWYSGEYSQRSPLFTPMSSMGLQIIQRMDTLWAGNDMDVSHQMTLIRRPGFSRYSSTSLGTSYPQKYFSFKNTAGNIWAMVETPAAVSWFNTTSTTAVITKHTTAQGSMSKVADTFYYCDGNDTDTLKWDGTNLTKWGIVAPLLAPTITQSNGTLSTVNGGYSYLYVYQNLNTGHISSSSPVSAYTLDFTSKTITLAGPCSTDTQVTNVCIYRTDDGGADYYYLASVTNTPGTNWEYADTTVDSGLNDLIVVTPGDSNNPPPTGSNLTCFYQNRYWIAAGPYLYFSGGPDITNGVPEECFPPANVFTLPGSITGFAPTSQGLLVFTSSTAYVVYGNTTATYCINDWQQNFGVMNQNCICQDGDLVNVFTTNGQLFQFQASTSGSLSEIGFPIQAKLAAFNPANVYTAIHRSGVDEGLFVSDGTANMFRYSISLGSWSTVYQPVGGCGALSSIEATTATFKLLMGHVTGNNYIYARDLTTNADDGTPFPCSVIIGSIVLASPSQVAEIESVLLEAYQIGTYPTVSVLLNEISGTFTPLPNPVNDPPLLPASTSLWSKKHYIAGAQARLARTEVRHLQVKLDFIAEDAATEVMGLAIS
jgi:hypothetical protein